MSTHGETEDNGFFLGVQELDGRFLSEVLRRGTIFLAVVSDLCTPPSLLVGFWVALRAGFASREAEKWVFCQSCSCLRLNWRNFQTLVFHCADSFLLVGFADLAWHTDQIIVGAKNKFSQKSRVEESFAGLKLQEISLALVCTRVLRRDLCSYKVYQAHWDLLIIQLLYPVHCIMNEKNAFAKFQECSQGLRKCHHHHHFLRLCDMSPGVLYG